MLQQQGRIFYWRFTFFVCLVLSSLTFQACGQITQSKSSSLEVSLAIPEGEEPSLFWFGVERKTLRWKPGKGETKEVAWGSGESNQWDINEGDKIEFLGFDSSGRLLIAGELTVGEEKKVTIPLRRVL